MSLSGGAQVLFDLGAVSGPEPFQRLVSQGMILGETEYTVWRGSGGEHAEPESPGAVPSRCLHRTGAHLSVILNVVSHIAMTITSFGMLFNSVKTVN